MQFQKLQHVVAHIQIVGKLSAKSKQQQKQPRPFIQMQICLLTKSKKENRQIYGQAYSSMV